MGYKIEVDPHQFLCFKWYTLWVFNSDYRVVYHNTFLNRNKAIRKGQEEVKNAKRKIKLYEDEKYEETIGEF